MKKLRIVIIITLLGLISTGLTAQIEDPGKAIPADPRLKLVSWIMVSPII